MLTYLWSWLQGYAVLHISGGGQERFLNLALQREIEVYETVWLADDLLEVKADYHELGALKKIAGVTGCSLQIRRRQGLPFAWRYLRRRKTLAAGMLLFAVGLLVASQFIFVVRVLPQEPLRNLDEQAVLAGAAELGVLPGAVYRRLDTDDIAEQLKRMLPEVSWVYIQRQGVIVNIQVAERSIYPEELERATIGAIWADRDALVEEVLLKHGQAMVSHGDTVRKGTLLVSPLADGRADAIIRARVWYQGYGEGALQEEVIRQSPESSRLYRLIRADGAAELTLWGGLMPPQPAEGAYIAVETTEYRLPLAGQNFLLPVDKLTEETVQYIDKTEEQAKAAALQQARDSLTAQADEDGKLLDETVEYQLLADGIWAANVRWECLEDIGERKREQDGDTGSVPQPPGAGITDKSTDKSTYESTGAAGS